ncbi:MAG: hypothetical protein ACW99Q_07905 [Candidatus Kariarchaeaceae archaeon]
MQTQSCIDCMLRWILVGLMVLHGLIHILGTIVEFDLMEIEDFTGKTLINLSETTRKVFGVIWFLITVLFLIASYGLAIDKDWWQELTIISILASQILVILWWADAKLGTVANILIIIGMVYV